MVTPDTQSSVVDVPSAAFVGAPLQLDGVTVMPFAAAQPVPIQVVPRTASVDFASWCRAHADRLDALLLAHRAILFRGFAFDALDRFEQAVSALSRGPRLQYTDRSTPRRTLGDRIFTSTEYPPEHSIALHNEGTYWVQWPQKIFFACATAPSAGGETPIADTRRILSRISAATRERFAAHGVLYVRNYNDGFGLRWQETFQTDDRAAVEAYCRQHRIAWEWKPDGRLRTRQVRRAIAHHPRTGELLWFNHAAFFHVSSLEPWIRDALLKEFPEEDLPYNTYYGDGSHIDAGTAEELRAAYRLETILFPWQQGDLLLLDNMTMCHGRQPYRGPRKVAVAMTEPCDESQTSV
jgi:alpha-ketoglutarate-dependent taurine dioxygenase